MEPYDGIRFDRKPLVLRNAAGKAETGKKASSESAAAESEETALATLELAGKELLGLFRGLADRLAENCTPQAARRKTPRGSRSRSSLRISGK